jgi:outer membrane protein assembly factor BamB
LNAGTGKLAWKYESKDQIRCFPTTVGDRALVAACDGQLHVVDLRLGKSVADIAIDSPTGCAAAALGDMVFVGTEGNQFLAIDLRQKKVLWRFENTANAFPFRSSAAVTPQAVVVGSRDKRLYAFEPKTGRPVWTFVSKGRIDSSPVVVGDRLFVGSADGRLYALDLKSGRELWRFAAGGALTASPAVAAGRLVIGTDDGNLYCFGAKP